MGDGPFNGPEDLHLADRCITRGLPQTWYPSAYNNGFQIVQSPGYVAVLYERLHEHRIIPLDGRAPLTPGIGLWFGDSRGRWEGETLVVEVTNFSDRTNFRGAGATRRLIERYTRVGRRDGPRGGHDRRSPRPGRGPGPRWSTASTTPTTGRCSSTPATRGTTGCATS